MYRRKRIDGISTAVIIAAVVIILIVIASGSYYFLTTTTTISSKNTSSSGSGLILYSADAYVNETQTLESAFTQQAGIPTVPPKSAGSQVLGQQIAQGDPVSVFISVSKTAVQNTTLKSEFGGWAIAFAADQMSLVYSNSTLQNNAAVNVIDSYNNAVATNTTRAWFGFFSNLTSGSVKVGISDPNEDPAGFRAWLVLEAAGYAYASNNSNYFSTRMLANNGNITSASAADLVAPLESGQIQFLFIYKSAGLSDKLNVLNLPPQVNLGSPAFSSYYAKFTYTISSGVQTGGIIALWITIPSDSTDPTDSFSFVAFVVKNAPALLANFGLTLYSPSKLYNDTSVPAPISQLISNGSLAIAGRL
jgi:molybdate/tungstate transport system substrate-binding protein